MFKRHYAIIAVVVISLGIGIAWAVHRPGEAREGGRPFTVLTLNVGDVGERVFPVSETAVCILAGGRPDVLFLQEMPRGKAGDVMQAALGYPYTRRAKAASGKLGLLMVASLYPIVETRQLALPSRQKGAGALCAVLDIGGEAVLACSVHLDEVSPKARNAEGQVLISGRELVDVLASEFFTDTVRTEAARALTDALLKDAVRMPVILAGDFDTVPGSRTIRHMGGLFQDVLWPGAAYFTGTYHKIAFPVAPRIDYIFVSDRLIVDDAGVVRQSAGDHYPVAARVRLSS
jgi:endonuclease/exonuclease/phosphatase family metal-dependent hydrolase